MSQQTRTASGGPTEPLGTPAGNFPEVLDQEGVKTDFSIPKAIPIDLAEIDMDWVYEDSPEFPMEPSSPAGTPTPDLKLPGTVPLDQRVLLLRDFFFNRRDKVAVVFTKGKKRAPFPVHPKNNNPDALIASHVLGEMAPKALVCTALKKDGSISCFSGRFRIGSYAPALDGTTRWLCLDFDGAGHKSPLMDARGAALETVRNCYAQKIPCYLERSGGGQGYHIWVFFEEPVQASQARALGFKLAPTRAPLQKGGFAHPQNGLGIEVFPKQNKISPTGVGNMVYLPWWSGAGPGANQFYPVSAEGLVGSVPIVPEHFETMKSEDLDWVLIEIEEDIRDPSLTSGSKSPSREDWKSWRIKALQDLPLDAVYGKWLTGKQTNDGWLECRDPFSPSGDQKPSAGVATGKGDATRGAFHSFISGTTLSVFDFLQKTDQAADFRDALLKVSKLSGVPFPTSAKSSPQSVSKAGPNEGEPAPSLVAFKPSIQVNSRKSMDRVNETWAAIHRANNPPSLFVRGGCLARIRWDLDEPHIEQMGQDAVHGHLIRVAEWIIVDQTREDFTDPPKSLIRDLLVNPDTHLPKLENLVAVPLFGLSGNLINTPGYHREDRLWYRPQENLSISPIPHNPTDDALAQARDLFMKDLLVDFRFVSYADIAHFMAAALHPFIRRMIPGPTPLHVIEAPSIGSGKSMLANLIAIIATGKMAQVSSFADNEEERRKAITTELVEGKPIIVFDNASQSTTLDSAVLAAVLTCDLWKDRLLGHNRTLQLSNKALWLLTGNNPSLSQEIARRCVRIRIDPGVSKPWQRQEFKHPDLPEWCLTHRGELIHALLTMVQAWIARGKPMGTQRLGSFEKWAAIIGGILEVAGISGFMGNLDTLYAESDQDRQSWVPFIQGWWDAHGSTPKRPTELNDLCQERDFLCQVRGDRTLQSQITRLGRALYQNRDRVFENNLRIVRLEMKEKGGEGVLYALLPAGESNEDKSEGSKP